MAATPVDLLQERWQVLQPLHATRDTWHRIEDWCTGTRPLIAMFFPECLPDFDEARRVQWKLLLGAMAEDRRAGRSLDEIRNKKENDDRARQAKARISTLLLTLLKLARLKASPDQVRQTVDSGGVMTTPTNGKVFIVHGHDGEMLHWVARVLESQGLEAVILNEQENQGQSIIEKFEKHADVGYAVVLLSPDDIAYPAKLGPKEGPKAVKPRARQNVVLELGYFIGKKGRPRVTVLQKGSDIEVPSDITGVVHVPFDGSGGWQLSLCKELRAAGYPVDLNKL